MLLFRRRTARCQQLGGMAYLMRISVTVRPSSKAEAVEKQEDGTYLVKVKAPPERGRANAAVVKLLSKYFNANIHIVSGFTSRHKIVDFE